MVGVGLYRAVYCICFRSEGFRLVDLVGGVRDGD